MKKVRIINFHWAPNHGAVLQAYALTRVIAGLGFDAKVLNYNPKWARPTIKNSSSFLNFLKKRLQGFNFKKFNKHLALTDYLYSSVEELKNLPPEGDYFICGSDQVWNYLLTKGDEAYLLSFVQEPAKRLGYAVSMGDFPFPIENKDRAYELIQRFHSLSAREIFTKDVILQTSFKGNVPVVLDPTLLLEEDDYLKLSSKKVFKTDYIAAYFAQRDDKSFEFAKQLKRKTGLPLVSLGAPFVGADKNEFLLGPENWLNRIRQAKYVITNSFHGTALSIIFKKKFVVIKMEGEKERLNSRFVELLTSLKMESCLIDNINSMDVLLENQNVINYKDVFCRLEERRNQSVEFLIDSLK